MFSVLCVVALARRADPDVVLTLPSGGVRVSVSSPYVITWRVTDLPPDAMLSLRVLGTTHDIAASVNGQPVTTPTSTSWLITSLLTEAQTKKLYASFNRPMPPGNVIEAGQYSWDLPTYCAKNTLNKKSVCQPGATFQVEAILRDRGDPCADRHECGTPGRFFKSVVSQGVFTFVE
jgi:hypothetical protein